MLKAITFLILLCFSNFIYASDDEEMDDSIPPTPSLKLRVKDQIINDDTVRKEIYSHAIKRMRENGVQHRYITAGRMAGVYSSLKDLESRTFDSELDAIHTARDQIDELVTACYLVFFPRRNAGYF